MHSAGIQRLFECRSHAMRPAFLFPHLFFPTRHDQTNPVRIQISTCVEKKRHFVLGRSMQRSVLYAVRPHNE
jgi:hypothetical protein